VTTDETVRICNFDIVCDLSIVIWNFSAVSKNAIPLLSGSVRIDFDVALPLFRKPAFRVSEKTIDF
jgi:hypothetical protein